MIESARALTEAVAEVDDDIDARSSGWSVAADPKISCWMQTTVLEPTGGRGRLARARLRERATIDRSRKPAWQAGLRDRSAANSLLLRPGPTGADLAFDFPNNFKQIKIASARFQPNGADVAVL